LNQLYQFGIVGLLLLVAVAVAGVNLLLPVLLGKKRVHDPVKDSPYECGMPPMADAHARFSVKFYLVAMLFILFDIEVIFFLGWSAVYKDLIQPVDKGGIGLPMLGGAVVFLFLLEVGHIYAWKKGALDWAPRRSRGATSTPPASQPSPAPAPTEVAAR
jgi:NADH-quinone oxidoreductase subunit A